MLLALGVGVDQLRALVGLLDRDLAVLERQLGQALRLARLEQLDDSRQTLRDVEAGDTTGVEGTHRQLGTGLADRLGGDDADRVAELGVGCRSPSRGRNRPGRCRTSSSHLSGERTGDLRVVLAANASTSSATSGLSISWLRLSSSRPRLVSNFFAARRPIRFGFGFAVLAVDRHLDEVLRLAVLGVDDHVLGDVDETTGQVTGVGGTQGGVREALTGTVGRDEVLEHRRGPP